MKANQLLQVNTYHFIRNHFWGTDYPECFEAWHELELKGITPEQALKDHFGRCAVKKEDSFIHCTTKKELTLYHVNIQPSRRPEAAKDFYYRLEPNEN